MLSVSQKAQSSPESRARRSTIANKSLAAPVISVPMHGGLDNILLYNRVLTSAEAQQLYTDPFCFVRRPRRILRATNTTSTLHITPLGVVSAAELGNMRTQTAQVITPSGIASPEKLGALQMAIANIQNMYPGAILSLETVGADTVIVAVPIGTPANRILSPALQYRIFNLTVEERLL